MLKVVFAADKITNQQFTFTQFFSRYIPLFCKILNCVTHTICRKDPKIISPLGFIYNSSLICFYLSNKRRFRQVLGIETDILHGISNSLLTRGDLRCVPVSITDTVTPR